MQRLAAAISFFTRLPLWRVMKIDPRHYERVVELWPVAGYLTGGLCALVLWLASMAFSPLVAALLALAARTLLTGALHEDGLADFADGMGGGTSRDRILAIMKDSHIGTYGVITIAFYYLICAGAIASMPTAVACATVLAADVWSKYCAGMIINALPYGRPREEAKNLTVYRRIRPATLITGFILSAWPLALLPWPETLAATAPIMTTAIMIIYIRHKIGAYTGDCCGAVFCISEMCFLLAATAILRTIG